MGILKSTIQEFIRDDCPRMAAALAYYTVFSLPALLILVLLITGIFRDPVAIQGQITAQLESVIGEAAAEQVEAISENVDPPGSGDVGTVVLSVAALLFAATGAFSQLQGTLNRVWEVEPDPDRGGVVRNFFTKRLLSFGMILGVALLLLTSFILQTLLSFFGDLVAAVVPAAFTGAALQLASLVLSVVAATLLFGVVFLVVPDARVHWRDAWKGALATGLLFLLGNMLLGYYLSQSSRASAYGAAGSLALILVWMYYSSMIFFLGAELTQVLARRRGEGIRPSKGAVRIVIERRTVRDGEA